MTATHWMLYQAICNEDKSCLFSSHGPLDHVFQGYRPERPIFGLGKHRILPDIHHNASSPVDTLAHLEQRLPGNIVRSADRKEDKVVLRGKVLCEGSKCDIDGCLVGRLRLRCGLRRRSARRRERSVGGLSQFRWRVGSESHGLVHELEAFVETMGNALHLQHRIGETALPPDKPAHRSDCASCGQGHLPVHDLVWLVCRLD